MMTAEGDLAGMMAGYSPDPKLSRDEYAQQREELAQSMRKQGYDHEAILDALDRFDREHPIG